MSLRGSDLCDNKLNVAEHQQHRSERAHFSTLPVKFHLIKYGKVCYLVSSETQPVGSAPVFTAAPGSMAQIQPNTTPSFTKERHSKSNEHRKLRTDTDRTQIKRNTGLDR